jgi:FAD/FMN-containing dehydrogenase
MDPQLLDALRESISGKVVTATDSAYETLRKGIYKTGSPAAIVQCATDQDVGAAIRFARDNKLTLSVRSGGHSPAGQSTNDGGLVMDLSPLHTVEIVNAQQRIVRIGAGATWGQVAQALAPHGLLISSGDTKSVGVGGLTLGGGIGWLVRKHGLAIDNLQAAQLVLADGRSVRASQEEHPDLFWAIRGGGGNMGVAVWFEFVAQPYRSVIGGSITYDIAGLQDVLIGWSKYMRTAPEELTSTMLVLPAMGPNATPQMVLHACYAGDDETALQPLLQLGKVTAQEITKKPYADILSEAPHLSPNVQIHSRNGFLKQIDEKVIAALAAHYGRADSPVVQIRALGGAIKRVAAEDTAYAYRDYDAFILAAVFSPADAVKAQVQQKTEAAWQPLAPLVEGAYGNFLSDIDQASAAECYPPATYARLASIKATYDPENIFSQNVNIPPKQ